MKRLFIDIPELLRSNIDFSRIECEYMYHNKNNGALSLLEIAEFAVYCRRCKESFCVDACPKEALERLENGTIKRYNMLCVGCKSCVLACPFGTIFPEVINYVSSKCDFCLNQLSDNQNYIPACVKTAPSNAFMIKEIQEDIEKNIYFVGDNLAIRAPSWLIKEGKL